MKGKHRQALQFPLCLGLSLPSCHSVVVSRNINRGRVNWWCVDRNSGLTLGRLLGAGNRRWVSLQRGWWRGVHGRRDGLCRWSWIDGSSWLGGGRCGRCINWDSGFGRDSWTSAGVGSGLD